MEEIVHPIFLVLPLNLLSMGIGQHKRKMLNAFNVEMPSYVFNKRSKAREHVFLFQVRVHIFSTPCAREQRMRISLMSFSPSMHASVVVSGGYSSGAYMQYIHIHTRTCRYSAERTEKEGRKEGKAVPRITARHIHL